MSLGLKKKHPAPSVWCYESPIIEESANLPIPRRGDFFRQNGNHQENTWPISGSPPHPGFFSPQFLPFRAQQAEFVGASDGFRAVGDSEFLENRLDVALHSFRADAECLAEFFP